MGMTGETGNTATLAIVCPSCNEVYDSAEGVREVLRNSGHCVNLTCLEDLSRQPIHEFFPQSGNGSRASDRPSR